MTPTTSESGIKTALTALETSLVTPVISGELNAWLANVEKTWSECASQVHYETTVNHARQYDEIAKADPELLPRVELMQAEDDAIESDRERLGQAVMRMREHAPKLEPDEEKAQQHLKKLVDEGIAFITRVRKQEVALETWFLEAFNRDRGAGD